MENDPQEKKIIIDEDWKSRVESERDDLERNRDEPTDEAAAGGGAAMPPASFEMLVTTLATEAMFALGHIPNPATGKAEVHLDQAKYVIDTLDVLETKTKGNLTPQENEALTGLLHQLRLAYVATEQAGGGQGVET